MWYRRRTILKSVLFGPLAGMIVGQQVHGAMQPRLMRVVTVFPRRMTEKEYRSIEKDFVQPGMFELFLEMNKSGEILNENVKFHPTHMVWEIHFRNLLASDRWFTEIKKRGLIDNERTKSLGFKVESFVS